MLEEDYYLQDVWVRGEVTNYTQAPSGHRYFSLKDERATLGCVLFRGSGGYVPPLRNGMAIVAHGRFSVFEQRGAYQFYVDAVEAAGIGELHLRFEELKARLEAEGLFAAERKRVLPPCPAVVGVVTSASAAALRDILRTLRLRCPLTRVVVAPTLVQGEGAAEQVAAALDALNAHGQADVVIVARGGGSLEELWAFNEEVVARAIARSAIPVVTGVGHETDFTIADFVADYRASTPTAAASAVVPDASAWREALAETHERLTFLVAQRLQGEGERLRVRAAHPIGAAARRRRAALARAAAGPRIGTTPGASAWRRAAAARAQPPADARPWVRGGAAAARRRAGDERPPGLARRWPHGPRRGRQLRGDCGPASGASDCRRGGSVTSGRSQTWRGEQPEQRRQARGGS